MALATALDQAKAPASQEQQQRQKEQATAEQAPATERDPGWEF
jgi:hypothetical protein